MISIIVIVFTLFGLFNILFKKDGIRKSLIWIIFAFILGYRTFEPFPGLKLHPIEIFVYGCVIRIIVTDVFKYRKMSFAVSILSIFFIVFFFIDLLTQYNPLVLLEFKNAFLLTMIFFITQHIHFHKTYLIRLLKSYLLAASLISILGIT